MNVYELTAKILLDDKEYKKGMKDDEKQAKSFGDRLKGGVGKFTKVVGAISAAATAVMGSAVVGVIKSSIQQYAEYEQLLGGIQKLYGNMGMSVEDYAKSVGSTVEQVKGKWQELEKAQNLVLQNANNAYKTAGMSANQYMEMATSFSASLISSLNGDTVAAAKQTDVAMRAISDNWNTFGGDIGLIQQAYQGFAKQNYTMLDNLKLGYGGTKQEMERLIADANEYAASIGQASDLSIDSFSDIVTAIDLVQQKQQIAGTTAREAATTIQGSFGMMKAAWENLVTGLSNPDADIGQLITNFVDSAGVALQNIVPVIKNALQGVAQLITGLAPIIIAELPNLINILTQEIPPMVQAIVQAIVDNADALITAAVALIIALVDGINQVLPVLIEAIPVIVHAFVNALIENKELLIQCGYDLIDGLIKGIVNAAKAIVKYIYKDVVKPMIDAFKDALGIASPSKVMMEIGKDVILGFIKGIKDKVKSVIETVVKIVKSIKEKFDSLISIAYSWGANLIDRLKSGISSKIEAVRSAIASIISAIKTKIQELINSAMSMGQSIINNFTAPLRAGISVARSIASSIASAVKSPLSALVGAVGGIGSSIGSRFASALRSALSGAAGVARSAASGIKSAFTSLINAAYNWGADLGRKFASGVSATISAVKRTISNLASQVRSLLHFSEPDEGPLSDFHTYAPDMMKLFAEGITKNAHLVSSAVEDAFDLGGIVTAGFSGATVSSAGVQRSGLVMTFADAVEAFKTALGEVAVELDDDEVGSFVRRTVVKSVYA